jgi:hypothetical protein
VSVGQIDIICVYINTSIRKGKGREKSEEEEIHRKLRLIDDDDVIASVGV